MQDLSKYRQGRNRPEQTARCKNGAKEHAAFGTEVFAADGFLRHRFLPLCLQKKHLPDKAVVEPEFFDSLAILSSLHGICPLDVSDKPYPYNILLAHWNAERQLNLAAQLIKLAIVTDGEGQVRLATKMTYDTGASLYYIPLLPLYRLMKTGTTKKAADLLLSVCAYLFQKVEIPCYSESFSPLAYFYEMIEDWVFQDMDGFDTEDMNRNISEINAAKYFGRVMLRRISSPPNLEQLASRMEAFTAANELEQECLIVAQAALSLRNDYAGYQLLRNITSPGDEEEEKMIRAEQYISFVAENKGWLAKNVLQIVNNEFNECIYMEEPQVIQLFNNPGAALKEGLDFERRLFLLIDDLCSLLNDLP